MKLQSNSIALLIATATLYSGLTKGSGFQMAQLDSATQNIYSDSEDDLEIDPVPMTFEWLRFGFDPRGAYYARPTSSGLFSFSLQGDVVYRNDQFQWSLDAIEPPGVKNVVSKMSYANIVQVGLEAKMYIGNLFLSLQGDYGWICNGKNRSTLVNTVFNPPPTATYHSDIHGHVEDYGINLGYYLKIYSGKMNRFYLAPQVRYQWNFQHYTDVNVKPKSALATPSTDPSGMITDIHLTYNSSNPKMRWYGPSVGLSFLSQLQRFDLELGGTYEWLEQHFENTILSALTGAIGSDTASFTGNNKLTGKLHTKYAYSLFLKLQYHLSTHWMLGAQGSFRQAQLDDGKLTDSIHVIVEFPGDTQRIDLSTLQTSRNRLDSWIAGINATYLF